MKKLNYYFTLLLVTFITLFSFFNMFQIVALSNNVIKIVINNLLPSLLPFMILISLCLSLGLLNLFSYFIQFLFKPLFKLSPIMSSIYFISFFCGYPTNVKMIKEAYTLKYINKPVGVSEYKIFNELPNNLLKDFPTEDELNMYMDIDEE